MSSKSDIVRYLIDQQVGDFLRGSPAAWRKTLQRMSGIDVAGLGIQWNQLEEAVQRRHAIIHNGGRADAEYLKKAPAWAVSNLELGSNLTCSAGYMKGLLESLRVFGIVFALRWASHYRKVPPLLVLPTLVHEIYTLERQESWLSAFQIASGAVATARILRATMITAWSTIGFADSN